MRKLGPDDIHYWHVRFRLVRQREVRNSVIAYAGGAVLLPLITRHWQYIGYTVSSTAIYYLVRTLLVRRTEPDA